MITEDSIEYNSKNIPLCLGPSPSTLHKGFKLLTWFDRCYLTSFWFPSHLNSNCPVSMTAEHPDWCGYEWCYWEHSSVEIKNIKIMMSFDEASPGVAMSENWVKRSSKIYQKNGNIVRTSGKSSRWLLRETCHMDRHGEKGIFIFNHKWHMMGD